MYPGTLPFFNGCKKLISSMSVRNFHLQLIYFSICDFFYQFLEAASWPLSYSRAAESNQLSVSGQLSRHCSPLCFPLEDTLNFVSVTNLIISLFFYL